jgi:polygalacturonase
VVYVPPGEYTTGTIWLKDNVNLHIEAGATLLLSQDKADFPDGISSMIYARDAKNIALTGRGTFDGLARYEWADLQGEDVEINEEVEIARKAGVELKRYYRDPKAMNLHLVMIDGSTDVRMEDLTLINSPVWNVRFLECDRVFVRRVHIYSDLEKGVNSDGIDICSSSNVVISDSIIVTADDAIVLKTFGRDGPGRSDPAKPVENVTVTNCILTSSPTPMMIGTETHADIRHVIFSNSVIRDSNKGFGINVQDGATVSDVIFSNITMDLNRRHVNWWGSAETFKFVLKKRTPQSKLGAIRDIVINNVISHARGTSTITGYSGRPLENFTISNLQMFMSVENRIDKRATDAIRIDRVNGLKLRNVTVTWAEDEIEPLWQSALFLRNVTGFEIDDFTGRQGLKRSSAAAVALDDVASGIIRDSRAGEGCGTFLHVRGERTKDVRLRGNDLRQARNPLSFEQESLKKAVIVEGRD